MKASEFISKFNQKNAFVRPRKNWKKELKLEKNRVIDEAIQEIRKKMRTIPKEWERGYHSAITTLELMKDK